MRQNYLQELSRLLKGVILRLRDPAIPNGRKRQILVRLSGGFFGSPEARLFAIRAQFQKLALRMEDLILGYVQEVKENDLFLRHYNPQENTRESLLNNIRREAGVDLGLNEPENEEIGGQGIQGNRAEYLQLFNENYLPPFLVASVLSRIEGDEQHSMWQSDIKQFIMDRIRSLAEDGRISQEERTRREGAYFNDNDDPTLEGTAFLLLNLGPNSSPLIEAQ